MNRINIVDYNPKWPQIFNALKAIFEECFSDLFINVEHVGSTSVPNLAAKPKIDLDIIVENEEKVSAVIVELEKLGYQHRGNLGIKGREAFARPSNFVPITKTEKEWMEHNLYICIQGVPSLQNHLLFRDYLRTHPKAVEEYGTLKKKLAQQFPSDIDAYVEGKTDFILSILEKCGFKQALLADIGEQNQKKE